MKYIGIDLGGTKVAGALFDREGTLAYRKVRLLEGRTGSAVAELIFDLIRELQHSAQKENNEVQAIGISVPGIAEVSTGKVWAPNIPGWDYYPLIGELKNNLNQSSLPVVMDSDRACYILGECWQGAAQGCRDAIFLAVGTGIGAGILVDGRVLRGHRGIAGATGWLALDRPYSPKYDTCGCFEYHASGPGLTKVAQEWIEQNPEYKGPLLAAGNSLNAQAIFAAFHTDDELAVHILDQAIAYWGMGVANLVSLFNPEKILFGGGVFGPATQFLERIKAEAIQWAQPISMQQVSIEAAALGSDAGLIGAGYLAQNASHLSEKS